MNRLFYGDNIQILRNRAEFPDESVDLIYLDPPFNSNKAYNVIFKVKTASHENAQIQAFDDTWSWDSEDEQVYAEVVAKASPKVSTAVQSLFTILGKSDVMSYIVMMTQRIIEMQRVLKKTGTLYFHCDPTVSHYVKVMLDAIFGGQNFVNEIIWHYNTGGATKAKFSNKHDVLLMYAKHEPSRKFNTQREPFREQKTQHFTNVDENGRKFRIREINGKQYRYYLDEGRICHDVWDIDALNASAKERLGYPTQKPIDLLDRIIRASSDPGDVVLDPFAGGGTTIDAAHRLGRMWVGIDITYIAIHLTRTRLENVYGPEITGLYKCDGVPTDLAGAEALFNRNPFDFERWAVSLVSGHPNEKQRGDKGIDGRVRFWRTGTTMGEMLVSVKGGKAMVPSIVRDLVGTVQRQGSEMGLLLTLREPTAGMRTEAASHGKYVHEMTGATFPKFQVLSVSQLLAGERPKMPTPESPYFQPDRWKEDLNETLPGI